MAKRTIVVLLVLSVAMLGACSKKKAAAPAGLTPDVTINMQEFAFVVTGTAKPGGVIRLRNIGQQFHMLGLAKLKAGKTIEEAKAALMSESETDDEATYSQVGAPGSFVGPGQGADIAAPGFGAGTYMLACFLNDEGQETPHFIKGMIGQLDVAGTPAASAPKADATYEVSKGKAVTGPATLKAGKHVLAIHRDATGNVLEPGLVKLDDGKTIDDFAKAIKIFDEGPLPVGAASKLPGKIITVMFDFNDETTLYLGVDLVAGKYVLVSDDGDVENSPDVPVERIEITVA